MKKETKNILIDNLKTIIEKYNHFYLADISGLNAQKTYELRKQCFEKDIELIVVKNTFFKKALEQIDNKYESLYNSLKNNTTVFFCDKANVPGKLIKEFNKKSDKPLFKAAYVEESIFVGSEQLEALATLKSKEELVGDIILLLQSPMKTVIGQLQSGKNTIAGVVKTLQNREN